MSTYQYRMLKHEPVTALASSRTALEPDAVWHASGTVAGFPIFEVVRLSLVRESGGLGEPPLSPRHEGGLGTFYTDPDGLFRLVRDGERLHPDDGVAAVVLNSFDVSYDTLVRMMAVPEAQVEWVSLASLPIAFALDDGERAIRLEAFADEADGGTLKLRWQWYSHEPFREISNEVAVGFGWRLNDVAESADAQYRCVLISSDIEGERLYWVHRDRFEGAFVNLLSLQTWRPLAGARRIASVSGGYVVLCHDRLEWIELLPGGIRQRTLVAGFQEATALAARSAPDGRTEVFISETRGLLHFIVSAEDEVVQVPVDAETVLGPLPGVQHFTWSKDLQNSILMPFPEGFAEGPPGLYRWVPPSAGEVSDPPLPVLVHEGLAPIAVEVLRGGRLFVGGRHQLGVAEPRPIAAEGLALGFGYVSFAQVGDDGRVTTPAEGHSLRGLEGAAVSGIIELIIDHESAWQAEADGVELGLRAFSVHTVRLDDDGQPVPDTEEFHTRPMEDEMWDIGISAWVPRTKTAPWIEIEPGVRRPIYGLKNPDEDWLQPYLGPQIDTASLAGVGAPGLYRLEIQFFNQAGGEALPPVSQVLRIDNRRCRAHIEAPALTAVPGEAGVPDPEAEPLEILDALDVAADHGDVVGALEIVSDCVSGLGIFDDFRQLLVFPFSASTPDGSGVCALSIRHGRTTVASSGWLPLDGLPDTPRAVVSLDKAMPGCKLGTVRLTVSARADGQSTDGWRRLDRRHTNDWQRVLMSRDVDLGR